MSFVGTLIKYTVACTIGVFFGIRLLIAYISNPSAFRRKKRESPPKCLTDSAWTHGHLSLKGIKIHYVEKGDRSKPLMLFVHGYPEFWYSWRYQLKEFSKDYWTVAIDMRGYGDSEKPSGKENYAAYYLVNDIKQIVEALGRKKFILVAHDWGGAVAWGFVIKHHDMLDSYIIMDAPYTPVFLKVVFSNWAQFKKSWYIFFFLLPWLPEITTSVSDFGFYPKMFRREKPKHLSPVSDEDIEAFKYTFGKPGALTPPINYYRQMLSSSSSSSNDNRKRNPELDIKVPGLLMFGEFDDYLILEHMTVAQKYVKNLEIRTVKGANHFVQQDDPETVNKYMREFLKK